MKSILLKYNQPTPRYTSYPPANLFNESVGNEKYIQHIQLSNKQGEENISVYIHTPFCKQKCHFCGCNSLLWVSDDLTNRYFDAVLTEIETVFGFIDTSVRNVTQVHWGGGTPNNLPLKQIEQVMSRLRQKADFTASAEIAIECNPAYLDKEYLAGLRGMGFTRISLGIQDFDVRVLGAINREASLLPIDVVVDEIRKLGFAGINLDFVYGLPQQEEKNFRATIDKAIDLRPERIVTFSYAHLPTVITGQRNIASSALPSDDQKLDMYLSARDQLLNAGYRSIGFDHYALPDDELAIASRNRTLRRNFQGYCTSNTTGQVYAFGTSGISQLRGAYFQNEKTVEKYMEHVQSRGTAVTRGHMLTRQEMMCQNIIEELLCNGMVDFDYVGRSWSVTREELFATSHFFAEQLAPYIADGLASLDEHKLELSAQGMLLARNVAQLFDPKREGRTSGHSRTI